MPRKRKGPSNDRPNIDVRLSTAEKEYLQRAAVAAHETSGPANRYGLSRFVLKAAFEKAKKVLKEDPPAPVPVA